MTMHIAGRPVGRGCLPYIIAEIGVNHNGSIDSACRMIDVAAAAGVDAVKTQFFDPDLLLSRASDLTCAQRLAGEADPRTMLHRLMLTPSELQTFVDHAHARGVHAIVSIFSVPLVSIARAMNWDAFKSASPDIINLPLLDRMADSGLPLIMSTGTATPDEIASAAERFDGAFLHCVSAYPTPVEHTHLNGIAALGRLIARARPALSPDSVVVGYSDHTREVTTGGLAVASGAMLLEKHFTLDRREPGPDHAASLAPEELTEYVRFAHRAWSALGCEEVRPDGLEADVKRLSRQSVVTTRGLPAGHRLTSSDLTIKRPGTGLSPACLPSLVGVCLARDVGADLPLTADDVATMPACDGAGRRATAAVA